MTSRPEGRSLGKTLLTLRRSHHRSPRLRRLGYPLPPGANRRVPNLVDCFAGGRVRRLVAGFVLQAKAFRLGLPLHVRERACGSPPPITLSHRSEERRVGKEG